MIPRSPKTELGCKSYVQKKIGVLNFVAAKIRRAANFHMGYEISQPLRFFFNIYVFQRNIYYYFFYIKDKNGTMLLNLSFSLRNCCRTLVQ